MTDRWVIYDERTGGPMSLSSYATEEHAIAGLEATLRNIRNGRRYDLADHEDHMVVRPCDGNRP